MMTRNTAWREKPIILNRRVQEEVFEFSELSDDVRGRIIAEKMEDLQKYHESIGYDFDFVLDWFEETLLSEGFTLDAADYDLSCSQGNGASFTGEFDSVEDAMECAEWYAEFSKEEKSAIREYFYGVRIERDSWNYFHENTVSVTFSTWDFPTGKERQEFYKNLVDKFEGAIEKWKNEMCGKLYNVLRDEMTYLDSAEHAQGICEDYLYFADGERVS